MKIIKVKATVKKSEAELLSSQIDKFMEDRKRKQTREKSEFEIKKEEFDKKLLAFLPRIKSLCDTFKKAVDCKLIEMYKGSYEFCLSEHELREKHKLDYENIRIGIKSYRRTSAEEFDGIIVGNGQNQFLHIRYDGNVNYEYKIIYGSQNENELFALYQYFFEHYAEYEKEVLNKISSILARHQKCELEG